jgi:alkylation response protein AidB-like acyl-CoA dehydrogenase
MASWRTWHGLERRTGDVDERAPRCRRLLRSRLQGNSSNFAARHATRPSGDGTLIQDESFRQKLADWIVRAEGYKLAKFRTMTALSKGQTPGPESFDRQGHQRQPDDGHLPIQRSKSQDHYGIINDPDLAPLEGAFHQSYMFAPGLRIAGGTDEILKNIIAERVLGLPQDRARSIRASRSKICRQGADGVRSAG